MPYVALENLIKKPRPSLYKLVLAAASRANELAQGAQPLVETHSKKVSTIALEEIGSGKVNYEETKSKGRKSS
jgi:DNA-directed RNA polymerase subunit omega